MFRRSSLWAIFAVALVACSRFASCNQTNSVAELLTIQGVAERSGGQLIQWRSTRAGETFLVGDAIRTQAASTARIRLSAGGGLNLGPDSLVRFVAGPIQGQPGAGGIRVESGEAELEAGSGEVILDTDLGRARLEGGGRIRVRSVHGLERMEVVVGRVVLDGLQDGGSVTATAGQRLAVRLAGAILETVDNTADAGTIPTRPVATGTTDAGATAQNTADAGSVDEPEVATVLAVVRHHRVDLMDANGHWQHLAVGRTTLEPGAHLRVPQGAALDLARDEQRTTVHGATEIIIGGRGQPLSRTATETPTAEATTSSGTDDVTVDLTVPLGESSLIHHAASTTGVRIRFGEQCNGGAMQIAGHARVTVGEGDHDVVLALGAGSHHYEVRCSEGGRRAGTLRIVRDAGSAPLPRRAGHTSVDADGRHYSVLYQNLLPEFTIRWPNPPSGSTFILTVQDHSGHSQTFSSHEPSVTLPSGRLAEGAYQLSFSGGGQHSAETSVQIRFDNAARAASVTEPADGAVHAPSVQVAGSALAGSAVSVGGVHLSLDSQNRFRGDVPVSSGEATLAIRIATPSHGIQYYLRSAQ